MFPVFVCGAPRSGTTLVGSILGSGTGGVVTPESQFVADLAQHYRFNETKPWPKSSLQKKISSHFRYKLWQIPFPSLASFPDEIGMNEFREVILKLVRGYAKHHHGQEAPSIWVDHTPTHIQHAELLLRLFPNAQFVHVVRDPRAVAASLFARDWGANTSKEAAIMWAERLGYGLALEQKHPEKVVQVQYETLVTSPKRTVQTLCEKLKLPFSEQMLLGQGFELPDYTKDQHGLVGQGMDQSRIDAWRSQLDQWSLYEIECRLESLMALMGYDVFSKGAPGDKTLKRKLSESLQPMLSEIKKRRFRRKKKRFGQPSA
ncbi:MAG: sulfotransferase [Hydrogenovibrio sp.]|uniref:sulfotransferase family protein n=1 Tax=Hydrogenovibrio sp. TaxID=2065821 RepID=UPI0028703570|nr:sulfotransferase [Hydrogenovibrio sp.]MDR9498551.1 sulfotransferase [Hydrogenovibrio sp.]MDR9499219.1 sulfotransferase [Hydrogenovibrio sp.]